jgi:hypothetical protein
MEEANLIPPIITQLYLAIKEKKTNNLPLTVEEALSNLDTCCPHEKRYM